MKKGSRQKIADNIKQVIYEPVSLTSNVKKLLESLIKERMTDHLEYIQLIMFNENIEALGK